MPVSFSEVYAFFKFRYAGTIPSVTNLFNFQTSGGVTQLQVNLNTNGIINLKHGTTSVTTTGTLSANQMGIFWIHYKAGSGTNGIGSLGFSLTEQEAFSGANFTSTAAGTATATIGLYDPENTNTGGGLDFYFGKARLSTTPVGSFPA